MDYESIGLGYIQSPIHFVHMHVIFDIDVKRNVRMLCQSNVRFISSTQKCIQQDKYK